MFGNLTRGGDMPPVREPGDLAMHERAEVHVSLRNQQELIITADTATGFAGRPQIELQHANGARQYATGAEERLDEEGRTLYTAVFATEHPFIDALVDVRGLAESGLVASAVEGFVMAIYQEANTYNLFGPRGAVAVRLVLDANTGYFPLWIGPAPLGLTARATGLTPLSEAFVLGSSREAFPAALRVDVATRPVPSAPSWLPSEREVGIYHWDRTDETWVRHEDSTVLEDRPHVVGCAVEQVGIYAAFARDRGLTVEELNQQNAELVRLLLAREQENRELREALQQNTPARLIDREPTSRSNQSPPSAGREPTTGDGFEGW